MEIEQLTDWLWCLRTPIVQAYAIREGDGFNLVDTTTADQEHGILSALAEIDGQLPEAVRVHEVLLTHGHDDHTGSAAGLRARTGARLVAPRGEADVIARERDPAPPQLADWEVPLFEQVTPNVPDAPPAPPDRSSIQALGWDGSMTPRSSPPLVTPPDAEIACFGHGEPLRRGAAASLAELARA